jgi:hypothetical protein
MTHDSNTVILSLTQQDLSSLLAMALGFTALTILSINVILNIFFDLSLHKTMRMIPEQYQSLPPGLLWLIIIPGVGYIFEWIMLPFGVPRTLESFFKDHHSDKKPSHAQFFGLGLATVIVQLVFFAPFFGAATWVLKIIYWAKAVNIRASLVVDKTNGPAPL